MSLLPFFDWCQSTRLALLLRDSTWAAPVIDIFHLLGLVMVFGPALILNLKLMGFILASQTPAQVAAAVRPWFWRGFAISATSGLLFFVGNAIKCYNVPPFYVKMALLAMAITMQTTLVERAAEVNVPRGTFFIAFSSLFLWVGVPFCGYWIELF